MTYKNSFLTSLKENAKRRNWVVILTFIAYMIYFPITTLLMGLAQQNSFHGDSPVASDYYIFQSANDLFYLGIHAGSMILVACVALFSAFQGYGFLHNKQKLDFYESVPVNKTKRFFAIYCNGFIMFMVAYLSQLLLTLLITMLFQPLTWSIISSGFMGFLSNLVVFFMCYNLFILSMVLTGNIVIAGVAAIVLSSYEIAIRYLVIAFCQMFLDKFAYQTEDVILNTYTSPIYALGQINYWSLLGCGLGALGLAYYAYSIRKVDACNKAVAFPKLRVALKIAITIPVGLCVAVVLYSMTRSNNVSLYIGVVIGSILIHMLFEAIYAGDVKGCLKNLPHMAAVLIIGIGILLGYQSDVFGYDSYVPKESQVESVAISGISFNHSWIDFKQVDQYGYWYESPMEIIEDNMFVTDVAPVLELASLPGNQDDLSNCNTVEVMYRMKNGSVKYRLVTYLPTDERTVACMDKLFADPNFKTENDQIYHTFFDDTSGSEFVINVRGNLGELQIDRIAPADRNELIECYRQDYLALTYDEICTMIPIGEIGITYTQLYNETGNSYTRNLGVEYPIYPSFQKTLSYLQSKQYFMNEFDIREIKSAEIEHHELEYPQKYLTNEQVLEAYEKGYFINRDYWYWANEFTDEDSEDLVTVILYYTNNVYDEIDPYENLLVEEYGIVPEAEEVKTTSPEELHTYDVFIWESDLADILK